MAAPIQINFNSERVLYEASAPWIYFPKRQDAEIVISAAWAGSRRSWAGGSWKLLLSDVT